MDNNYTGESTNDAKNSFYLGSADTISIEKQSEREYDYVEGDNIVQVTYEDGSTNQMTFDELGTREANVAAADYLRNLFEEEGLLERGVSVLMGEVLLEKVTNLPNELEFNRSVPLGVIVLLNMPNNGVESQIQLDDLIQKTPRAIKVKVRFNRDDYFGKLPVVCEKDTLIEE